MIRILFFLLMIFSLSVQAQNNSPLQKFEVGLPCPEFSLTNVDYFSKNQVNSSDFKGKWLVLDFWTQRCVSCIQGFPKINKWQQEFEGQVQFFLVGNNSMRFNSGIKPLFDRIRKHQGLQLPIAYDSSMFARFNINATPCLVLIDPKGIVRKIAGSGEFSSEEIQRLIDGTATPKQIEKPDTHVLVSTSTLSKWVRSTPLRGTNKLDRYVKNSAYRIWGTSLNRLYQIAYFGETDWGFSDSLYGKAWMGPLLELKDPSLFNTDFYKQIGMYNYEISVGDNKGTKEYIQFALQCDLKKHFGYEVAIERREMPCWNVVITAGALNKLKSKASVSSTKGDASGFVYKKVNINRVLRTLCAHHTQNDPFIDKTGYEGDIDIQVNADLTNFEQFKAELKRNGLELVPGKKEMNVLVIKERKGK